MITSYVFCHYLITYFQIYNVKHEKVMRIRADATEGPFAKVADNVDSIEREFMERMQTALRTSTVHVMLGDATVTTQKSFEPGRVTGIMSRVADGLEGWMSDGVLTTNNEDIRRIFVKFRTKVDHYTITGHLSVQFHVLLYYKLSQRVIDCQKELSDTIDAAKIGESDLAEITEKVIQTKLKSAGYDTTDNLALFEVLYNEDKLRQTLEDSIHKKKSEALRALGDKKTSLFAELDSLLTETYQTVPVLIDDTRLVTGEEGCLCTFDVEYFRNQTRRSIPHDISDDVMQKISDRLEQVRRMLVAVSVS